MNFEDFISSANSLRKKVVCHYCANEKWKEAVDAFLEKKEAGDTYISATFFFNNYLLPEIGVFKNKEMLFNHIRKCLNRDPKTGKRATNEETG